MDCPLTISGKRAALFHHLACFFPAKRKRNRSPGVQVGDRRPHLIGYNHQVSSTLTDVRGIACSYKAPVTQALLLFILQPKS